MWIGGVRDGCMRGVGGIEGESGKREGVFESCVVDMGIDWRVASCWIPFFVHGVWEGGQKNARYGKCMFILALCIFFGI